MSDKNPNSIVEKLIKGGMNPSTPVNAPAYSLWVKDNANKWKLYGGSDSAEVRDSLVQNLKEKGYGNYRVVPNGEDWSHGLDDYDLFKELYHPAWHYGRDNYLEGEEEAMYDELNKYFDLPPFQKASKENGYEGNVFLVNPATRSVSIKRGTESFPLKRR